MSLRDDLKLGERAIAAEAECAYYYARDITEKSAEE
jgi:hypothetical protein